MYRKYRYKAFREGLKFNHGVFNVVEIFIDDDNERKYRLCGGRL